MKTLTDWLWIGRLPILFTGGFLLNVAAYYPGFISPDGIDIYGQALTGNYDDWHPPLMAQAWRALNSVWKGPQLFLILQLGLLWTSGYLLWKALPQRLSRALLLICLVLAPWVQNFAGTLFKDVQMAFCYLLATALLLRAAQNDRRMHAAMSAAVFALLAYGTLVRINALPAVLPLLLLWSRLAFGQTRGFRTALGMTSAVVVLLVLNWAFNSALPAPRHRHPEAKLFLHDLTGIYVHSGDAAFPTSLYRQQDFDTAWLRSIYTPATFDESWWSRGRAHEEWALPEEPGHLRDAWLQAIRRQPLAYLQHRSEGALYYLQMRRRTADYHDWYPWIHPNEYGLALRPNRLRELWLKPVESQRGLPWMHPAFWMLLNVLLLVPSLRLRNKTRRHFAVALLLSGILYQLPSFFIFQTDLDFRYFYWNCIGCSLAGILCLFEFADTHLPNDSLPKTGRTILRRSTH